MSSQFKPHGNFSLRTEGQIIVQQVQGPWNLEMVEEWNKALTPLGYALDKSGYFAAVIDFKESAMSTPDAVARMRRVVESSVKFLKPAAHAVVAGPDVEGYLLVRTVMSRVFQDLTPYAFFDALEPALQWLQEHIDRRNAEALPK